MRITAGQRRLLSSSQASTRGSGDSVNILHSDFKFSTFVRLLNLKNDTLRKKFDGIKYDLKKVEEVVYDLSIRGLNKTKEPVEEKKDES